MAVVLLPHSEGVGEGNGADTPHVHQQRQHNVGNGVDGTTEPHCEPDGAKGRYRLEDDI